MEIFTANGSASNGSASTAADATASATAADATASASECDAFSESLEKTLAQLQAFFYSLQMLGTPYVHICISVQHSCTALGPVLSIGYLGLCGLALR